jgi:RNA polymerase sigma factor (TIGR02999 family)
MLQREETTNPRSGLGRWLRASEIGDGGTRDRLLAQLYRELRALAHRQLGNGHGRRTDRTLCTTALVHEAFLRVASSQNLSFDDRGHFLGYAAHAMRSIVVDEARRQQTSKRGGGLTRVQLSDETGREDAHPEQLIALDQALTRLAKIDQRLSDIAELRIFGGVSQIECSQILDISPRTAQRLWRKSRAMLASLLVADSEA